MPYCTFCTNTLLFERESVQLHRNFVWAFCRRCTQTRFWVEICDYFRSLFGVRFYLCVSLLTFGCSFVVLIMTLVELSQETNGSLLWPTASCLRFTYFCIVASYIVKLGDYFAQKCKIQLVVCTTYICFFVIISMKAHWWCNANVNLTFLQICVLSERFCCSLCFKANSWS